MSDLGSGEVQDVQPDLTPADSKHAVADAIFAESMALHSRVAAVLNGQKVEVVASLIIMLFDQSPELLSAVLFVGSKAVMSLREKAGPDEEPESAG